MSSGSDGAYHQIAIQDFWRQAVDQLQVAGQIRPNPLDLKPALGLGIRTETTSSNDTQQTVVSDMADGMCSPLSVPTLQRPQFQLPRQEVPVAFWASVLVDAE